MSAEVNLSSDVWYIKWLSSCLWYDEWCSKHPVEYLILLESCDMQLSRSICYKFVTLVYQSKQPVWWSLKHQMDHLAVVMWMSGPVRFLLSVTVCPHVTLTSGVWKLQDLVQKICTLKEGQEEAEMSVWVAGLVSSCTLPWQETSAGRSWQMACGGLQSRHARDE